MHVPALLSPRRLARSTAWGMLGVGLPLLAAVWAVPILIATLGTARFGLLSLLWAIIGYFSVFDLGIGRALTKLLSERIGAEESDDNRVLVGAALALLGILGIISSAAAAFLAPFFVDSLSAGNSSLATEAQRSIWILSAVLPVILMTNAFVGALQVRQRFAIITMINAPIGVASFVGAVIVAETTDSLTGVVGLLCALRLTAWVALFIALRRDMQPPTTNHASYADYRIAARKLLGFGGWVTVSGVISPVLVYADRFIISSIMGLSAFAYYSAPQDLMTRLAIASQTVANVVFPALSTALASAPEHTARVLTTASIGQLAVLWPLTGALAAFAPEALTVWLGADFAQASTSLVRAMAVGLLFNGFARVATSLLHAAGRPRAVAAVHTLELPIYVGTLWLATQHAGLVGAATAWACRCVIDALLLSSLAAIRLPALAQPLLIHGLFFTAAAASLIIVAQLQSLEARLSTYVAILLLCALSAVKVATALRTPVPSGVGEVA